MTESTAANRGRSDMSNRELERVLVIAPEFGCPVPLMPLFGPPPPLCCRIGQSWLTAWHRTIRNIALVVPIWFAAVHRFLPGNPRTPPLCSHPGLSRRSQIACFC